MKKNGIRYIGWTIFLLVAFLPSMYYGAAVQSQDRNAAEAASPFDKAVAIIKKYEGLHSARHWPLVGYGHKVLPTDKFKRGKALTEAQADQLLREDLSKLCRMYSSFGKDSLLLATLAYNLGHGAVNRSTLYKKLKEGDRDIKDNYLSHCRYKGKVLSQLKRRREEEFETLFNLEPLNAEIPELLTPEISHIEAAKPSDHGAEALSKGTKG